MTTVTFWLVGNQVNIYLCCW